MNLERAIINIVDIQYAILLENFEDGDLEGIKKMRDTHFFEEILRLIDAEEQTRLADMKTKILKIRFAKNRAKEGDSIEEIKRLVENYKDRTEMIKDFINLRHEL
jgi:hypothetical protein